MNNKVYLVWKCIDDPQNYWPCGQETLLNIFKNKEDAIACVNKNKKNIMYDLIELLQLYNKSYNGEFLKIQELYTNRNTKIKFGIEGKYDDITVHLTVKLKVTEEIVS